MKLRKEEILKATDEFNKRKYDRTLWYSIADPEILRLGSGGEDNISYVVNDAVKYGIEAAILLSNVKYWTTYNMIDTPGYLHEHQPLSPAKLSDHSLVNLPMNPWTVRRALRVLAEDGALERKRSNIKGDGSYLYRAVETRHGLVKAPDSDYPTERTIHD